MGKILITADLHNGIPNKLDDTIWSMEIIRQYANDNNIKEVIVAGDLFHDRSNLSIPVLNGVYDTLKKACEDKQTWHIFPGNHDMFLKTSWDQTSLRIFHGYHSIMEQITPIEIYSQKFWCMPFMHFEHDYMEALAQVEKRGSPDDILLTHIGVNNAVLNECFLLKHWSTVNFDNVKFKRVYTGHFHCHQQVGDRCWYPGSPIPFRFDEGVVEHGFFVYDTDTSDHQFIKTYEIGSKYSKYRPPDYPTLEDINLATNMKWIIGNHVRVVLTKEYTSNERTKLRELLLKKGAKTVDWTEPKRLLNPEEYETQKQHISSPKALFEQFCELDKPKLNRNFLNTLHDGIQKEAEERLLKRVDNADSES